MICGDRLNATPLIDVLYLVISEVNSSTALRVITLTHIDTRNMHYCFISPGMRHAQPLCVGPPCEVAHAMEDDDGR